MTLGRRGVVALLGAAALSVSACGGGGHSSHPAAAPSTPVQQNISPVSTGGQDPFAFGPATIRGATKGGTVTVLSHHALWAGLDPTDASTRPAVSILSGLVTRSLTQYRYDPRTQEMVLTPDLSLDVGRHNDDYSKWAFRIRRGARFEDGSHVTAWAVARGIRRCRDRRPFPHSPCSGVPITSVRVRSHQSVFVTLSRPYPDFAYLGTLPALGPIPRQGATDLAAYRRHPLASGPYRISRFRRGSRLVLVRNTQWDPASDPGRTQYPDGYDFRLGQPSRAIAHALLADHGAAQTTLTYDSLPPGRWLAAKERTRRFVRGVAPCTTYLAPDNRVISNVRVRRALIWAFPYRAVLRLERLTSGVTALPATNLLPPGIAGRTLFGIPGHHDFATRPGVARRMLASVGALGTSLPFSYDPGTRNGLRFRALMLSALQRAGFAPRAVAAGSGTPYLRLETWCGAWPHGGAWLPRVYQLPPSGSSVPVADLEHFVSKDVDARISAIQRLPLFVMDPRWNRLDRTVLQRWQPIVPLWYAGVAMAHGSRIQGMVDDSVHGMPVWQRLWMSP